MPLSKVHPCLRYSLRTSRVHGGAYLDVVPNVTLTREGLRSKLPCALDDKGPAELRCALTARRRILSMGVRILRITWVMDLFYSVTQCRVVRGCSRLACVFARKGQACGPKYSHVAHAIVLSTCRNMPSDRANDKLEA
jgi:hypothetical protein